jgi:hypothetical protein
MRAVYEIMWNNMVKLDRPQTFSAHCMLDNLGYIHILRIYKIFAFPQQG